MIHSSEFAQAVRTVNLGISFAVASFATLAPRQSSAGEPMAPTQQTKTANDITVPIEIVKAAANRGIPASHIQIKGNQWVACISAPGEPEVCAVLGKVSKPMTNIETKVAVLSGLREGDVLVVDQYGRQSRELRVSIPLNLKETNVPDVGTFARRQGGMIDFLPLTNLEARILKKGREGGEVIDTLPSYRREFPGVVRTRDPQLVKDYLAKHPDEPFLVIVTVPAHCEPCRRLDETLKKLVTEKPSDVKLPKIFLLEYFDFERAKGEVVGDRGLFPTILTFVAQNSPERGKWTVVSNVPDSQQLIAPIEKNLSPGGPPRLLMHGGVPLQRLSTLLKDLKR